MSFGTRVLELAGEASLQVSDVNERRGLISFNVEGRKQVVWIIPYDDIWEFSVQSAVQFSSLEEFPQGLLAILLAKNSKNKRSFWCMEELDGKHVLSAMANLPETALTAAEFDRICHALVLEVDNLEQALMDD